MKPDPKLFGEIHAFLKGNRLLSLATHAQDTWICTLYYGIDDQMNLYLVTDPNSRHGKQIQKNPRVAFAVFDSHTKVTDPKKGIQGQGICSQVKGVRELIKGLMLWHQANPGKETRINFEMIRQSLDTRLYKIQPAYLKFFNKELYGQNEYGVLEL